MKFIAIGELMLRLSPPNYEKIVTTHDFIVNYGGAEAMLQYHGKSWRRQYIFSALSRTTAWERARSVCCAAMMCTVRP